MLNVLMVNVLGLSSFEEVEGDPSSEVQTSPLERAQTLFAALDIDLVSFHLKHYYFLFQI